MKYGSNPRESVKTGGHRESAEVKSITGRKLRSELSL